MQLHIRSRKLKISGETNNFIEERLTRALNRFAERIRGISVLLTDVNGPKGGTDKVLRITVLLSGCERVVLTAYGSDVPLMIDETAARIKLRVSSAIAKTRHFDPQQSIRKELVG